MIRLTPKQILLFPVSQFQRSREGLAYIISRMPWYSSLPKLLKPDTDKKGDCSIPRNHRLRQRIVDLYKAILLYEMIVVRSQCNSSSGVPVTISDEPKVSDPSIAVVVTAETSLATFESDDTMTRLNELMPPETHQERGPAIVDHRKTSESISPVGNFEAIDPGDTVPNLAPNDGPATEHLYQWLTSRTEYADFAFDSRNEGDN